jgi:hypothetical protein
VGRWFHCLGFQLYPLHRDEFLLMIRCARESFQHGKKTIKTVYAIISLTVAARGLDNGSLCQVRGRVSRTVSITCSI